jgi:hypothetical protein
MQSASLIQLLGAGGLGFVIGWYVYYINRYRKSDVQISDLLTLIGAIGGGATTALFSYFLFLILLVSISKNFTADWFLDGRRKKPEDPFIIPDGTAQTVRAMGGNDHGVVNG